MNSPDEAVEVSVCLIVLRSSDIHRSAEFYRAIGLQLAIEKHGTGPEHYCSRNSSCLLEIYPLSDPTKSTQSTRIGFQVTELEKITKNLEILGAKVIQPPAISPWGYRSIVRDFDGHTVELFSPNA